jgi:phosphonate transport system substrate-binding protein
VRKRPIARILCVLCLPLLAACSAKEPPAPVKKPPVEQLLIGLIPEQNIFSQLERYEPLMEYVGRKAGVRFELKVLPRYGNIVSNFQSRGLDGAFFGSFTYTLARARMGLNVVARPENDNGVSTYHGLIFVRKDSGIRTAKEMAGKRLACVDKATTAGYLLPLAYFRGNGILDHAKYLEKIYFTGTHEDAILDVLNRKADIGAAKNTVFDRIAAKDPRIRSDLRIVAVSPEVPENALALRADLEDAIQQRIRDALLGMHQDPAGREVLKKFGAARFVETAEKDYEPVLRYAREVQIDLATYDYLNE